MQPWRNPAEALRPASADDFLRELGGCLALVAPVGMNDQARTEWLVTARATLSGIPSDLLERGCKVARAHCDHPSKIVPTIMREVESAWASRKRNRTDPTAHIDRAAEERKYVTPEQVAAIKAEFALSTNPYPAKRKPTGVTPKMPTREDYIALGVPAEALDRLTDQRGEAA